MNCTEESGECEKGRKTSGGEVRREVREIRNKFMNHAKILRIYIVCVDSVEGDLCKRGKCGGGRGAEDDWR